MDERRRAATVEVDRALGAEVDHDAGELEHRQPGVDVGAPPVAGHGDQRVVGEPERRPRMTVLGDVGVELLGRALKPS